MFLIDLNDNSMYYRLYRPYKQNTVVPWRNASGRTLEQLQIINKYASGTRLGPLSMPNPIIITSALYIDNIYRYVWSEQWFQTICYFEIYLHI